MRDSPLSQGPLRARMSGRSSLGTQGVQELFFMMHLKDQGVKIWSYYHFNMYHVENKQRLQT